MKIKLFVILCFLVSNTYSKSFVIGDVLYPNLIEYELMDYSASTHIYTYLFKGVTEDLLRLDLELKEVFVGIKNNRIVSVDYNLFSKNSIYKIDTQIIEKINQYSSTNLTFINERSYVTIENDIMFSLVGSNNSKTFNKDRIVYSKVAHNEMDINNNHSNEINPKERVTYVLMGLPKMLEYTRMQLAFDHFNVDYILTGCEVLPMYVKHNNNITKNLDKKHGIYWNQLHNQLFIKEMYHWYLIQELVKNNSKFQVYYKRNPKLHMYIKKLENDQYCVKINKHEYREEGFKEISICQFLVDASKKNVVPINKLISETNIDEEEFGSFIEL